MMQVPDKSPGCSLVSSKGNRGQRGAKVSSKSKGLYLKVVGASGADKDAVPNVKGVHHKEVDDGLQQILEGVAEAEGEGQH